MKHFFTFFLIFALLLAFMPPTALSSRYHDADSLQHVIETASRESDRQHAMALLAQELMPEHMDSARVLLEAASPLKESPEPGLQAQYFNVWGLYYWFSGDRQASIDWFKKTLDIEEDRAILHFKAAAANNTGAHFMRMGLSDSARVYLMRSLDIDRQRDYEEGMAKTYYDLSRLHRWMDQHELALQYIHDAIGIQQKVGDKQRLMYSYRELGDYVRARQAQQRSLEIATYKQTPGY